MFRANRFNTNASFAVSIKTRHIAQHQPHFTRRFQTLHHLLVQLIAILKEMVNRAFFTMRRHQRFHANLVRFDVVTRFTRQNHQLTHHIFAGKIYARIGFSQTLLPCLIHQIGEWDRAIKLQEQPRQRAGEDPADRQNGIATINQIAHGMVDRQTCTHGGVI